MSVRAHKIIEIKHEEEPSFNVSANYDLVEEFIIGDYSGSGIMELDINMIREAVSFFTKPARNYTEEQLEILHKIIFEAGIEDYVQYWCF